MQLLMRRPEIFRFVAISPQPNIFDFNFLAPCPTSGLIVYGNGDQLVPKESMQQLKTKLINQKNITVEFDEIKNANHSFVNLDAEFNNSLNNYIQKESRLF